MLHMAHDMFRVTKTLAAWQCCCAEIWQFIGFCGNFHQNSCCFVANSLQVLRCLSWKIKKKNKIKIVDKFPQKLLSPCWKFSQKVAFMYSFHQKMPLGEIFTKCCLYGKFPRNFAWLANFHNNRLSEKKWFVRTFPQNFDWLKKKTLVGKVSAMICFVGKYSHKFAAFRISTYISFFGKLTQEFAFLKNFHILFYFNKKFKSRKNFHKKIAMFEIFHKKNHFCKNFQKNLFVEKIPQQFALLENFYKK